MITNKINIRKTLIFMLVALFFISCQNESQINLILSQAESLMIVQADSALINLEQIQEPEKMAESDYATWCLLITQARDKNYIEHTTDSVIKVAVEYFEKTKDDRRKAQALFYQGRIQSDLKQNIKAISCYLKANDYAQKISDTGLKARIREHLGVLYWDYSLYENAKVNYEQALGYYQQDKDTIGVIYTLYKLGNTWNALKQSQKAITSFQNALELSQQAKYHEMDASLSASIGNVYKTTGELSTALTYLKSSLSLSHGNKYPVYYSLASLYYKMQQPDSAFMYIQDAMKSNNLNIKCDGYRLLYYLYHDKGNAQEAYTASQKYIFYRDSIEMLYPSAQIIEAEALYNNEKQKNNSDLLLLKEQKMQNNLLLALFASYIIASIAFYLFHSRLKTQKIKLQEKQILLQESKNKLNANQQEIDSLQAQIQNMNKEIVEKQQRLDCCDSKIHELEEEQHEINNLIEKEQMMALKLECLSHNHNQILREHNRLLIETNPYLSKLRSAPSSIFTQKDQEELMENFNKQFPSFITNLKEEFPNMSDIQIRTCCLVKLNLNTGKIADILNQESNTISKRKKAISTTFFTSSTEPLEDILFIRP